jgi:hypothetical protein
MSKDRMLATYHLERFQRKDLWANLGHYPVILLYRMINTANNVTQQIGRTRRVSNTYPLRDVNLEPKLIGFLSRSGTNKTSVGDKKYEKIDIFADNNVFSVANI